MQRLEVSGAVRPMYGSLGVKGLISFGLWTPEFLLKRRKNASIPPTVTRTPTTETAKYGRTYTSATLQWLRIRILVFWVAVTPCVLVL